jgi:hypothetical protein
MCALNFGTHEQSWQMVHAEAKMSAINRCAIAMVACNAEDMNLYVPCLA